jgi:uncharacterized protein YprB with RNaseH-like and TPR domain
MRNVAFDIETTGLSPEDSKIVAIAFIAEQRGTSKLRKQTLVLGENGQEKDLIQIFVSEVEEYMDSESKLISYNGDTFDWPFLVARSMQIDDYGDTTDKLFELKEKYSADLIKTEKAQKPFGGVYSLDDMLRMHGLTHGVDCDGSQVLDLVNQGDWATLRKYVKEDALMTYKLYNKMKKQREEKH